MITAFSNKFAWSKLQIANCRAKNRRKKYICNIYIYKKITKEKTCAYCREFAAVCADAK